MQTLKNKIKAIFLDIDGTLVSFKTHEIPESARIALNRLHSDGIKIFIATGRPPLMINNLDGLEIDGYVTMNGCLCFTSSGIIIRKSTIPSSDLKRLIEYSHSTGITFACMNEQTWFVNKKSKEIEDLAQMINIDLPEVKPIECVNSMDVIQVIGFFPEEKEKEIFSEILLECEPMRWHHTFADIIKKGNNKSVGIHSILDFYDIDISETMAFGDGSNDIPMLETCAVSVAMGNAKDMVKSKVSYVTTHVDDDGIYNALKYYGLL